MAAKKQKRKPKIKYFDYNLLFLVIFLLCFGLVMLYSSSSYASANKYNDSAYFLKLQIRNIIVGAVFMLFLGAVDYRMWRRFAGPIYMLAFGLCAIVLFPGIGSSSHGSSRWLKVGPIQFQPSEAAKLAMIIFFAMLIEKTARMLGSFKNLVKVAGFALPLFGIVASSNLSTAVIILGIVVCMLFVASPKYIHFVWVGAAGLLFILAFISFASYRSDRIAAWRDLEGSGGLGYQTLMGMYAIGSGGLFGKGLGNSLQKLGNVPESQNDMIFTIICEELGLLGAICVILLFVLLLWRMMIIANNAKDLFGSLLVVGVMTHVAIQVILNIAVVTNTIPNTGVVLPFISYGGTSIIFLMGEMGLVLSVSKSITLDEIE